MAENNFKEIELKWQKFWDQHPELYQAREGQGEKEGQTQGSAHTEKKYVLVEFPYPSGTGLHVGHAFTFTGGDVYARFNRMKGLNVLFPMGWDAFGLPTENYAIKTKQKPQKVTADNTAMFKRQMERLAFSFDWSREINTTDPNYYKWTQWIFIQLFKKGLAYKQEMPINWCPSCKIGLANEEVLPAGRQGSTGKCERCGSEVERRTISQWVLRITKYADRLLDGLAETDFETKIKAAQINWIGKSEGARVKFQIKNPLSAKADISLEKGDFEAPIFQGGVAEGRGGWELEVFTTRPDTLYGATFMVVAPEHAVVSELILRCSRPSGIKPSDDCAPKIDSDTIEAIKNYVKTARSKSEMERTELSKDKTGVFSGLYAVNPATGKEIPIWISDFVLASYGTGAIMAVPAHDERDHAFAVKFGLPIIPVIKPEGNFDFEKEAYTEVSNGVMFNSPEWDGLKPEEAIKKAIRWIREKGIGEAAASYHLRDWIFSRQHYWGEPIPMIFCKNCAENQNDQFLISNDQKEKIKKYAEEKNIDIEVLNNNPGWYPVTEGELPVKLPEVEAYEPTDDGKSPLSKIPEFVNTVCPVCGMPAIRETDTMPNWAGSDWYFMRYIDPFNDADLASKELLQKWLPVDLYIGGDEHTTLHLLYSRFIYKFLFDIGVVPTSEPYQKRMNHGVILGTDGQRMSKSHGNVIVPEVVADKYGVDATRMYLMFMGPFDATMAWNENTLMGVKRFLDKFFKFIQKTMNNEELIISNDGPNQKVKVIINKLIKGVGEDLASFKFNTAIAKLMEALNEMTNDKYQISNEEIKILIKLMAPLAPYLAEEMWSRLRHEDYGEPKSVHAQRWPEYEDKYLIEETVQIPVAVNGKVRSQLTVNSEQLTDKNKILEEARNSEKIKQWIEGKEIVKEIYVPGKMVNLVLR